jgi:hypothetical protein
MRYLWPMLSLSAFLLNPVPAQPADLTKIDRTLKKEPAYKGTSPGMACSFLDEKPKPESGSPSTVIPCTWTETEMAT